MSDTPRTDAYNPNPESKWRGFAQRLERELRAAIDERDEARQQRDDTFIHSRDEANLLRERLAAAEADARRLKEKLDAYEATRPEEQNP